MSLKSLVWIGFSLGSFVGGYVPTLWDADMISFAGLLGSFIGGIAGIWGGYKLHQMIDS